MGPALMPRARKTEAVRLKELEIWQDIVASPLVLFVASFTAIELLQNRGWVGQTAGSVAEVALGSIAIAQAVGPSLAPILPSLIPAPGGGITSLIPGVP